MKTERQTAQVELPDEINPEFLYSGVANRLLVQIVRGEINAIELARQTLALRGVDTEKAYNEWANWEPRQ